MKFNCSIHSLTSAAMIAGMPTVFAQSVTKEATGTDLADDASWVGVAPTASDLAVWESSSLGSGLILDSAATWNGIDVNGALTDIDLSGSGVLTLGSGGIDAGGSGVGLTLGNAVSAVGSQTWTVGSFLNLDGAVSGSDPLVIAGESATTETYNSYLTPTAAVAYADATLSEFTRASGIMNGGFISGTDVPAEGYKFENDGTTATFQLRFVDGGFTKCVKVELLQDGANITARAVYAKFISGANLAFDFDTGGSNGTIATSAGGAGYGCASLSIGFGVGTTTSLAITNPHSGGMTLDGGTVIGGAGVAFNGVQGGAFGTGDLTLQNGATVRSTDDFSLGGGNQTTRVVSIDQSTLNIEGAGSGGEYFTILNLTGGTITADTATPYFRAPTTGSQINTFAAADSSVIATRSDMTFTSTTLDVADGAAVNDLIISGAITQNTGAGSGAKSLTKNGAGRVLLSGGNTFTGGVVVNAGSVAVGSSNALGALIAGRPVTQAVIADGATIDLTGQAATYGFTVAGDGVGGAGALLNSGGTIGNNLAQTSNLLLSADASIGGTGNWSLLTNGYGPTSLDLGGFKLSKVGGNTIALVNATATAGTIEVLEGTLALGVTNNSSGSDLSAAAIELADVSGANLSVVRNSSIGSLSGGGASGGDVVLNGGTLTVGALGTDTTFAGLISGTGAFVKTGAGTLTVTEDIFFTGPLTVEGGTLAGMGEVNGNVSVGVGGVLSPAGSAIGEFLSNSDLSLAGTTIIQVDSDGGLLTSDLVDAALGTLTYGGTLEIVASGDALVLGDSFQIFDAATYQGAFATLVLPTLSAGLSWDVGNLSANGTISVSNAVLAPLFNPVAGNYVGSPSVSLSGDTGSTFYFTTDGSDPTTSSTLYTVPIPVPANTVGFEIRALATKPGLSDSAISSAIYNTLDSPAWNVDEDGDWSDSAKWLNGVIPDQAGVTADFTFTQTDDALVTLDSDRTIGGLLFASAGGFGWEIGGVGILTFDDGGGTPVIDVAGSSATLSATVSGTAGLTKTGVGDLTLSGSNGAFSGTVTVDSGGLNGGTNSAFGSGSIVLGTTSDAASLILLNRADITNDITVSGSGSGLVTIGGVDPVGSPNASAFGGTLTLNRATTILGSLTGDRVAIDGQVSGNVGTLTITGGSRTTFASTANDFVGDIVVTGPDTVFQPSVATAAEVVPDTADVTIEAGASMWLASNDGQAETIDALNGGGSVQSFPSGNFGGGGLAVGAADGSGVFSGILSDGNLALPLFKVGAGTQELSGANAHTGTTTVSGGTLLITGDSSAATGDVVVEAGATLGGNGTLGGPVLAASGSIVSPGTSVGTLTAAGGSSLVGTLEIEVDGSTADQFLTSGAVDISGLVINFTELNAPTEPSYAIISAGSVTGTLGSPTNVPVGYEVNVTATSVVLQVAGGSPYDSWASDNGLVGGDALVTADVEPDGLSNLLEFGFGTNPNVADLGPLTWAGAGNPVVPGSPTVDLSFPGGGGVDFKARFVRRKDFGSSGSVTYAWRFSSDLVDWESSADTPGWLVTPTVLADDASGDYELVEVPYPLFLDNGEKARFFQVEVNEQP